MIQMYNRKYWNNKKGYEGVLVQIWDKYFQHVLSYVQKRKAKKKQRRGTLGGKIQKEMIQKIDLDEDIRDLIHKDFTKICNRQNQKEW